MRYLLVKEVAKKWNISERSVRNYCTQGRVDEARLNGKTWEIPEDAQKPGRINRKKEVPKTLLEILQEEKKNDGEEESLHGGMPGGHCGRSKLSCQK